MLHRKALLAARYLMMMLAASSGSAAFAFSEAGKTITAIGVDGGGSPYYVFNPAPLGSCYGNFVYGDLSTDKGRAQYSLALTARSTGKQITWVDYVNTGGTCYLQVLEM